MGLVKGDVSPVLHNPVAGTTQRSVVQVLIRISVKREAAQTSKMSDTAVSSLTANGLLSPASSFVFFVVVLLGPSHSGDAANWLFKAACQLSGQLGDRWSAAIFSHCVWMRCKCLFCALCSYPICYVVFKQTSHSKKGPNIDRKQTDTRSAFNSPAPLFPYPRMPSISLCAAHVQRH